MKQFLGTVVVAVCLVVQCASGQEVKVEPQVEIEQPDQPVLSFGGDNRTRYEFMDNWPKGGGNVPGTAYEEYLRFRTRVWGEAEFDDSLLLRVRIGNEFRSYRNSEVNRRRNKFPDELFVDNLYARYKNDIWELKAGRFEIMKGALRVLGDGTAADGSRTLYFNGAVLTYHFAQKSSVDFMGTWNHYRDDMTVGNPATGVYDLTFMRKGDPYSKMDEGMLGAYAEIRELENLPYDLYWIWKKETSFHGGEERFPGRDFHTVGFRMVPSFNDWLSGELEAAYQFGSVDSKDGFDSRDISAGMAFGGLTAKAAEVKWTPSLRLGALYMSGDKDSYYSTTDGSTDTGWNPVFGRLPPAGDIPIFMYDVGRWSNLLHLSAELSVKPAPGHTVSYEMGPMYAIEKDYGATDHYRGLYMRAVYKFPVPTVAGISFNGLISGDVFEYGDYFVTDEDRATSIRLELIAKF